MRRVIGLLMLVLAAPTLAASGEVTLEFTRYTGPIGRPNGPLEDFRAVDGIRANFNTGDFPANDNIVGDRLAESGIVYGSAPLVGGNVEFELENVFNGEVNGLGFSILGFEAAQFDGIVQGQDFRLGSFFFVNAGWFGDDVIDALDEAAYFEFTLTTTSDSPEFNQSFSGRIRLTSRPFIGDIADENGIFDFDVLGAAADSITLESDANLSIVAELGLIDGQVFPGGVPEELSFATVDLIGRFDSLHVVGFANPGGGGFFVTPAVAAIPEPGNWALLVGGFGLVGATLRRRRMALYT